LRAPFGGRFRAERTSVAIAGGGDLGGRGSARHQRASHGFGPLPEAATEWAPVMCPSQEI